MDDRCYVKAAGGSDLRPLPSGADPHEWARDSLPAGSSYWVIKTAADGQVQPKAQLHRLPIDQTDRSGRTLDDMATDLANEVRREA